MAQWAKMLADQLGGLSSILGTHEVDNENRLLQVVL